MMEKKRKILILIGHYLPGYKDGGPVRSIQNLTDRLGDAYDFRVVTRDRDAGDSERYPGIELYTDYLYAKAKVYYVAENEMDKAHLLPLAKEADLVYVCGCFNDYARAILSLKKSKAFSAPLVIASMGLFSPGAFQIKHFKKKSYMNLMKLKGAFKNVIWSATDKEEEMDIRREVGRDCFVLQARDLPRLMKEKTEVSLPVNGEERQLRVIFLSRISRKKNLLFAAEVMRLLGQQLSSEGKEKEQIIFHIYGNMEDKEYYEECKDVLKTISPTVSWKYMKEAPSAEVVSVFSKYDLFLFPTMAENYGHVILEALQGGCVPIISDKTPWTEDSLGHTGRVIPLDAEDAREQFAKVLRNVMQMTGEELLTFRQQAADFGFSHIKEQAAISEAQYRAILNLER